MSIKSWRGAGRITTRRNVKEVAILQVGVIRKNSFNSCSVGINDFVLKKKDAQIIVDVGVAHLPVS